MSRVQPALPAHMFKTYAIAAPLATHFRRATCADVQCRAYLNGWETVVAADSPQAEYIRKNSGRRFTEARDGDLVRFTFEPGQTCFAQDRHRMSLEREPTFLVRGGDHRGNPSGERRVHASGEDWRDDFQEHQSKIEKSRS